MGRVRGADSDCCFMSPDLAIEAYERKLVTFTLGRIWVALISVGEDLGPQFSSITNLGWNCLHPAHIPGLLFLNTHSLLERRLNRVSLERTWPRPRPPWPTHLAT